jgi:hypothetical protein
MSGGRERRWQANKVFARQLCPELFAQCTTPEETVRLRSFIIKLRDAGRLDDLIRIMTMKLHDVFKWADDERLVRKLMDS